MISKTAILKLLNILFFVFAFHSLRDVLQLLGVEFWLTIIFHQSGIKITDEILKLVGLSYGKWIEIIFLIFECFIIRSILKNKKKIKLGLAGI